MNSKATVWIFTADECHFCEDFKPRFWDKAYMTSFKNGVFPIMWMDATNSCPQLNQLMDSFGVDRLPFVVIDGPKGFVTYRGAISDRQIDDLLYRASFVNLNGKFPRSSPFG